ncbi:MAG: glutamine-hydrolyzing carbamoyl-phosphate synthase small subunit [Actinomycetota bacterium]
MLKSKAAVLLLEDGKLFAGEALGTAGESFGEIVFNTSMTGYQEILTDPSYAGQLVAMTYPHIGNYGINEEDMESRHPFLAGFIVREQARMYSNWRGRRTLGEYLKDSGLTGIQGIDTRALTKHIRTAGAMKAVVSAEDTDLESLKGRLDAFPSIVGLDLVKGVTIKEPYVWPGSEGGDINVTVLDYGAKTNIMCELASRGAKATVVPAATTADEIMKGKPHGVMLTNGPGDPAAVTYAIETVRGLLGRVPLFGICLGHQLLGLALGGSTFKLKFGHRGANHPVMDLRTRQVEITTQNHGFAVDADSFPGKSAYGETGVEITHVNLNDQTVEGIRCTDIPAFSVQYHPEASPGPCDSKYLFDEFFELMT